MKSLSFAKVAVLLALTAVPAVTYLGVATSTTACGEGPGCDSLRNSTYTSLQTWQACDPQDPTSCIYQPGNPKDCTGVLSCDFAVNPIHRAEAEEAVQTIGQKSQSCYLCATPNCIQGSIPWCEPVSRRCMLVTQLLDGGTPVSVPAEGGASREAGGPAGNDAGNPVADDAGSD
jgi:hypothetical protein